MKKTPELKRCQGMHKVLIVDQWTDQGAQLSCLLCPAQFHADYEFLEKFYSNFTHHSYRGQDHDIEVCILDRAL